MDICLIYFSSSVKLFQEEDMVNLLQQSRRHTSEVGITGVLLYVRGQIIQVLEGTSKLLKTYSSALSRILVIPMFPWLLTDPLANGFFLLGQWALRRPAVAR
jgi:hypothetical protein